MSEKTTKKRVAKKDKQPAEKMATTKPVKQTEKKDAPVISRMLRCTKPLIKGADVKAVQKALIAERLGVGIEGANGVYNAETAQAVRYFQSRNRLIVSGKVEKFTAQALGFQWKDPSSGA